MNAYNDLDLDQRHAHTWTHTHTHILTFKVYEEMRLEDVFFSSEENLRTMISTQMAADIMKYTFKIEFSQFNKSEFNVIVAITSHQVEALKNDQNTQKQKQDDSLGAKVKQHKSCAASPY